MSTKHVRLTSYSDRIFAEFVLNLLQSAEIDCYLRSDDVAGVYASITASSGVHIWVREDQAQEAIELLQHEKISF